MFSNTANNSLPFSKEDLRRVLTSPEGQKLLALLRSNGGNALDQAAQAVRRGDYASAQTALEPMLRDPEAQRLVDQLKSEQS